MASRTPTSNRRAFLKGIAAAPIAAIPFATHPNGALAQTLFADAQLRGSMTATDHGMVAGAIDDQSRQFQKILDEAAAAHKPVFLPPGNYFVSNINLPANTRLMGVPGASRLVYTGGGHFLISENGRHVELTGVVIDGANRGLNTYAEAALRISNCEHMAVNNCQITGSLEQGLQASRSKGRIEGSTISGAMGDCGVYALENRGLTIRDNEVEDCSNGGILVHRWAEGEDGSIVTGNRIRKIGAANGGTGQWGNGINVFRAHAVMIANNQVSDCAFSAIRSNAGNNVQIASNHCLRSGETAIYSEFGFNGAMISGNVIDGAARGVAIANFMQGGRMAVCANNLIRNIHLDAPYKDDDHFFGIGISAEADTTITGNVVEGAQGFGLLLGWGPYLRDVIATSNVIRQSPTGVYVSVVEGAGNTVISDNVIAGASKGAIVGYRWHEAATGDMGGGETGGYDHLAIERNRIS